MNTNPDHEADSRASPRWWRWMRAGLVTIFVCWHLLFLFSSNTTVQIPGISKLVRGYETYAGLDQQWGMFSSPLWRKLPFPAVRLHFTDGSSVVVLSDNEPRDMTSFFRFGGARQRKFEHYLITRDLVGTYQEPMQRRLAFDFARNWMYDHPKDGREIERVVLISRTCVIPKPGEKWKAEPEMVEAVVASFPWKGLR